MGVGHRLHFDGEWWEIFQVEQSKVTRRSEFTRDQTAEQLGKRPLNRYLGGGPHLDEFERGDIITEEFTALRVRGTNRTWCIYPVYRIRKGDL